MNLTTSKRISLIFSVYTIIIVLFFGILINVTFFRQWYNSEKSRLVRFEDRPIQPMIKIQRFEREPVETIPFSQELFRELKRNEIFFNITKIGGEYIMFSSNKNNIKVSNVSRIVEAQIDLLVLFAVLMTFISLTTYFLSLLVVRKSLSNLTSLVTYVKELSIHHLDKPVPISGPEDDEIRIIGSALQESLQTIKTQTDSLRDFVTHASHELKTPLMSLNAVVDVAQKTGNYEKAVLAIKGNITKINSLFDTLITITKREHQKLSTEMIDLRPVIDHSLSELTLLYKDKNFDVSVVGDVSRSVKSNSDVCYIIIHNLIHNAFKYTSPGGQIKISLSDHSIVVANSGESLSDETKLHIWDKFWKDHSRAAAKDGVGLGLYLVKLLVTKLGWNISIGYDQKDKQIQFIITF